MFFRQIDTGPKKTKNTAKQKQSAQRKPTPVRKPQRRPEWNSWEHDLTEYQYSKEEIARRSRSPSPGSRPSSTGKVKQTPSTSSNRSSPPPRASPKRQQQSGSPPTSHSSPQSNLRGPDGVNQGLSRQDNERREPYNPYHHERDVNTQYSSGQRSTSQTRAREPSESRRTDYTEAYASPLKTQSRGAATERPTNLPTSQDLAFGVSGRVSEAVTQPVKKDEQAMRVLIDSNIQLLTRISSLEQDLAAEQARRSDLEQSLFTLQQKADELQRQNYSFNQELTISARRYEEEVKEMRLTLSAQTARNDKMIQDTVFIVMALKRELDDLKQRGPPSQQIRTPPKPHSESESSDDDESTDQDSTSDSLDSARRRAIRAKLEQTVKSERIRSERASLNNSPQNRRRANQSTPDTSSSSHSTASEKQTALSPHQPQSTWKAPTPAHTTHTNTSQTDTHPVSSSFPSPPSSFAVSFDNSKQTPHFNTSKQPASVQSSTYPHTTSLPDHHPSSQQPSQDFKKQDTNHQNEPDNVQDQLSLLLDSESEESLGTPKEGKKTEAEPAKAVFDSSLPSQFTRVDFIASPQRDNQFSDVPQSEGRKKEENSPLVNNGFGFASVTTVSSPHRAQRGEERQSDRLPLHSVQTHFTAVTTHTDPPSESEESLDLTSEAIPSQSFNSVFPQSRPRKAFTQDHPSDLSATTSHPMFTTDGEENERRDEADNTFDEQARLLTPPREARQTGRIQQHLSDSDSDSDDESSGTDVDENSDDQHWINSIPTPKRP
ncbi:hypothetical protein BLNAU_36 [Blattamonas nauphoetae]|uniref:Uncharacterized protein n=1 Tax=Blattamonas nauphoetae TaxID=2049346 RepID=A0ABQ9YLW5_9EUKA|nr:hypothetical protein BLNAU_36 [Blattamonas nauphoetae]